MSPHSKARGVHWNADRKTFVLDARFPRLKGGRLAMSLRTKSARDAEDAAAAIRTLYHRGDFAALERLRAGELEMGEVRAAVRTGDFDRLKRLADTSVTLGQAIDWLMDEVQDNRKPKTLANYRATTGALLQQFGPDTPLSAISRDALLQWMRAAKPKFRRPWAATRKAGAYIVGNKLWRVAGLRLAEKAEAVGLEPPDLKNPWRGLERPKVEKTRVVFFSGPEWRRIVETSAGYPRLGFVACLTLAGLRMAEAANLRLGQDVDLDEALIRVQPRDGRYPWRPKNEQSQRTVPMCGELRRLLGSHIQLYGRGGTYCFRSPASDQPLNNSTTTQWVEEAYTQAGVEYGRERQGKTAHTGRHTFATWMLLRGVPVHVVARLMGDRPQTVLSTYSHLMPEDMEAAVGTLDRAALEGM